VAKAEPLLATLDEPQRRVARRLFLRLVTVADEPAPSD
jgi:hypothetical protein